MSANLNTVACIGVRRMIYSLSTPDYRCFEPIGVTYAAVRANYEYLGSLYAAGATIPFDVGGASYSKLDQLERDFNAGLIDPTS